MIKSWKELEDEIQKLSKLVDDMKKISRDELIEKNFQLVIAGKKLISSIAEKFNEIFKVIDFLRTSNMNLDELGKIEAMVKEKYSKFEAVKKEFDTTVLEVEIT